MNRKIKPGDHVTDEQFFEMLEDLEKVDCNVRGFIQYHGGYNQCPKSVLDLIDERLGIKRTYQIIKI